MKGCKKKCLLFYPAVYSKLWCILLCWKQTCQEKNLTYGLNAGFCIVKRLINIFNKVAIDWGYTRRWWVRWRNSRFSPLGFQWSVLPYGGHANYKVYLSMRKPEVKCTTYDFYWNHTLTCSMIYPRIFFQASKNNTSSIEFCQVFSTTLLF